MNKCINCGNDLIPGDKFCRRCGTPINNQNNMMGGMPNQMASNNVHFTSNMNTQMQNNNTGYNNQYNGNFNNNFNNNLNSNINYNANNSAAVSERKDNLSSLIIIIVALVIGVLFILFMPTIKKTEENDTIIIKDNPTTDTKKDNNSNGSINYGDDNNNNNNNSGNNSGNNSSNPNTNKKNTLTYKGATITKRTGYTYTQTTYNNENVLMVQNNNSDDMIVIQGIYKASISAINSKKTELKNKYIQSGYQVANIKYTTYKNKKLFTMEVSQNSYKMLAGYYEIDNGIVTAFVLYDKNYSRYNHSGYAFLANIFDGVKVSSSVKNGMSYEIKADLSQFINNFLTKQ